MGKYKFNTKPHPDEDHLEFFTASQADKIAMEYDHLSLAGLKKKCEELYKKMEETERERDEDDNPIHKDMETRDMIYILGIMECEKRQEIIDSHKGYTFCRKCGVWVNDKTMERHKTTKLHIEGPKQCRELTKNWGEYYKTWSQEMVVCECGKSVQRGRLGRHRKTPQHLKALHK